MPDAVPRTLVLANEELPLGGTSTFVLNLCSELQGKGGWRAVAGCMRRQGVIGVEMEQRGLPLIKPAPDALLHEDRLEQLYRGCARSGARAVVASLGGGSFDFLRFVPAGCLRLGIIQSDDELIYQLVERYLPWIDGVACVSREICRKMEARLGGRRIPVIHQPYGVPMDGPPRVPQPGTLRVLYLGRVVHEQKRSRLMAAIMEKTVASGEDIRWTIAGDGPELPLLREKFGATDRVSLLGAVPYHEVPALFPGQDVKFLCSDYEGLPLSLLEAMGAGLVPVVSDLPSGISEVVNDANGIRVPIDQEDAYVDALLALARDRARLESLSAAAAREVRASHSTEAMAARWQAMLDELTPAAAPVWDPRFRATATLDYAKRWKFHPLLRPLRRAWKKSRQAPPVC